MKLALPSAADLWRPWGARHRRARRGFWWCCCSGSGEGSGEGSVGEGSGAGSFVNIPGCCGSPPLNVTAVISGACCAGLNQSIPLHRTVGTPYIYQATAFVNDCFGNTGIFALRVNCKTVNGEEGWYVQMGPTTVCTGTVATDGAKFTLLSCDPFHMIAVQPTVSSIRCCAGSYTIEITE